jgi:hypothetical protein
MDLYVQYCLKLIEIWVVYDRHDISCISKKILLESKECFAITNNLNRLIGIESVVKGRCVRFINVFKNIQIEKIAYNLVDKSIQQI